MGVRVRAASLAVSGGPAAHSDADDLRSVVDGLMAQGIQELSVDVAGALISTDQTAELLAALAEVEERMRAGGGRCRLLGLSSSALVDALAAAPLIDAFAIYVAVRNESRISEEDRS